MSNVIKLQQYSYAMALSNKTAILKKSYIHLGIWPRHSAPRLWLKETRFFRQREYISFFSSYVCLMVPNHLKKDRTNCSIYGRYSSPLSERWQNSLYANFLIKWPSYEGLMGRRAWLSGCPSKPKRRNFGEKKTKKKFQRIRGILFKLWKWTKNFKSLSGW